MNRRLPSVLYVKSRERLAPWPSLPSSSSSLSSTAFSFLSFFFSFWSNSSSPCNTFPYVQHRCGTVPVLYRSAQVESSRRIPPWRENGRKRLTSLTSASESRYSAMLQSNGDLISRRDFVCVSESRFSKPQLYNRSFNNPLTPTSSHVLSQNGTLKVKKWDGRWTTSCPRSSQVALRAYRAWSP